MKKAFTMLELVFVIVVIGILVAAIVPSTRTNPLQEAAVQVLSHIRYTQHLAMVDDKYDADSATWFRERWQIIFSENEGSADVMGYTIFSDEAGGSSGNPDEAEIARNPSNTSRRLTGGWNNGNILNIDHASFIGTDKLNVGRSYGVTDITFSNTCDGVNGTSKRIAFDHLGRPLQGTLSSNTQAYDTNDLIQSDCDITLTHTDGNNIIIRVQEETGFSCILDGGVCI